VTTLPGIDVSGIGQGATFDWGAWKGRIQFAFAKASEALTFTDPDFARNWAAMKALGIVPGAYHFIHAADSGAAQANRFLEHVDPQPGELLMVDVEEAGFDGRGPEVMSATVGEFADVVRAQTGAWPVTYCDISTARGGYCASVGMTPLFLANPSRVALSSVGPWRLISFEQLSQRGTDVDAFYGDIGELRRLTVAHARSKPAPVPAPAPVQHGWRLVWTSPTAAPELVAISSTDGKTWH
jgi:lysozyme